MVKANKKSSSALSIFTGALTACAASVALVALFALALQKQWLSMDSIAYVNAGIKLFSAALAAFIAVRRAQSRALLIGACSGALYMIAAFAVFSLVSGELAFDTALLLDIGMCALTGAITGAVHNLRSRG